MKVKLSLDASPSVTRPMFRKSTGFAIVTLVPVRLTDMLLAPTTKVLAVRLPKMDTGPFSPSVPRPSVPRLLAAPVMVTETPEFRSRLYPPPLRVLARVMGPLPCLTVELPARMTGPLKAMAPPFCEK